MSSWLLIAVPVVCVLIANGVAVALLVHAARSASNARSTIAIGTDRFLAEHPLEDELEALWRLPAHREPAL